MEKLEQTPQETNEGRDAIESSEPQALDDATFAPETFLEERGEIRQAEELQEGFTRVISSSMESIAPAEPDSPNLEPAAPSEPNDRQEGLTDRDRYIERMLVEVQSQLSKKHNTSGTISKITDKADDQNKKVIANMG